MFSVAAKAAAETREVLVKARTTCLGKDRRKGWKVFEQAPVPGLVAQHWDGGREDESRAAVS